MADTIERAIQAAQEAGSITDSNISNEVESIREPRTYLRSLDDAEAPKQRKPKRTAEEIRANQEAAGIPDSRPFINAEPQENAITRIEACHINGVLVKQLNLDPQVLAALDYWQTDEGIAEKNARPNVVEPSGITAGPDEWDKSLKEKREDVLERGYESYEARDPLRDVAEQYAQPGMRAKFLSQKKIKDGSNRDYQVVKQANGDPVMVRGMVLG